MDHSPSAVLIILQFIVVTLLFQTVARINATNLLVLLSAYRMQVAALHIKFDILLIRFVGYCIGKIITGWL